MPRLPPAFCLGLALFVLFVAAMEGGLAVLGYHGAAADSELKWSRQRLRADQPGERKLAIIGGSRSLLGLDLEVLRAKTGREPVQLAIDGNTFWPTLEGLAADPAFRGDVLIDYHFATQTEERSAAALYNRHFGEGWSARPSYWSEQVLGDLLHDHLRAYAGGVRPYFALRNRLMARQPYQPPYVDFHPDRSRRADYSQVPARQHMVATLAQTMGWPVDIGSARGRAEIERRVTLLQPEAPERIVRSARRIAELAHRIGARGGKVVLVVLPVSGLIGQAQERSYPRELAWKLVLDASGLPGVHFMDEPALAGFDAPDGSHLDARDRGPYTRALADILAARHAF